MGLFSKELFELDKGTTRFMMDEMQDEIDALQKKKDSLQKEKDSLQKKNDRLQDENKKLVTDKEEQDVLIKKLRQELAELRGN